MAKLTENPATIVTPLVRYTLIALGGGLISKGYIDQAQIDALAGAVVATVTTIWMVMVKRKAAKGARY
ncbi:MAG: Pam3-gp28 family putative phage holin [Psychrobacter alimentarius]